MRAGGCLTFPALGQALRVSMEEQRQRQEEEARRAAAASAAEAGIATTGTEGERGGSEVPGLRGAQQKLAWTWGWGWGLAAWEHLVWGGSGWNMAQFHPAALFLFPDSDDALLKMTISQQEFGRTGLPDLSSMTEEEQIAYAMQMSLQGAGELGLGGGAEAERLGGEVELNRPTSFPQNSARQNPLTLMPIQPWTHLSLPR